MCKDKNFQADMDTKIKDADDAESKERLMQAKRLWNLRWCYTWYNRRCELEEKMYRRKNVSHQDMLLTSNLNLCVIQQVLKVALTNSCNSNDDLFRISETEQPVFEGITAEPSPSPDKPVGKKKYNLLKTPLHYIRVLKNKISRKQNRYRSKAALEEDEGDFPLLTSVESSSAGYEQTCDVPSRFEMSCDLIDFVASSRDGNKCGLLALQCPACHIQQVIRAMGLKLQSPLNPEESDGPRHSLGTEWKGPSAGEEAIYSGDVSTSEKFPRATALQLLEESTHSPICVYYIIRTIVRSVIASHFFNFLKTCKKRNDIENNLTTILRNAQDNHFLISNGWRKELHSSHSSPVQRQTYSHARSYSTPVVDTLFTSSYARDPRERAGLPYELRFPWHSREQEAAGASRNPSEYLLACPQPYYARGGYAVGTARDPEKSKTL